MEPDASKISYHRLSTTGEPGSLDPSSQVTFRQDSQISRTLPVPTIIEDLQTNAQVSNTAAYPLLTRYLPNDINIAGHRATGFLSSSPSVLSSHEGNDGTFDYSYSPHLLGEHEGIFKYSRLQSAFPNQRFFCTPFSINPTDIRFTSLQWNWPIVRQACLLAFCACLAAILCVVVGLLISTPFTPCEDRHRWFRGAVFYEIFPASFQDTDGDGFGDFQGIIQRLDYIKNLGVRGIRLNSVFCALDYPLEYEHIIDLRNVDPHLGRIRDFKELVKESHRRGLRIILEINPTVTSDQHTWALHWQRGIDGYQHFYASANRSKDPPEMEDKYGPPPEEWELSQRTFGGHYVVNWSNPSVQKAYIKTLSFWIDAGVDGFYMKHLEKLHVLSPNDIIDIAHQWREELDRFRFWSSNSDRALITSLNFVDKVQSTLEEPSRVLRMFDLIDVPLYLRANYSEELTHQVTKVESSHWRSGPGSPGVLWHMGSADTFRLASRIDPYLREAALYALLLLPESVSIFYGDEIGLTDSYDVVTGIVYRGGQLVPMLWTTDNVTAGFTNSTSEPWFPLTPELLQRNVKSQGLLLQRFSTFTRIRNAHGTNWNFKLSKRSSDHFQLIKQGSEGYKLHFCANFGHKPFVKTFSKDLREFNILASTGNFSQKTANFRNFTLNSGEAFVAELHM